MIDKVQLRREIPRYIRTPQFRDNKDDNLISPAFETKFREKEEEYRKDKNKYSMYNTFLGVLDMADEKAQEISATLLDCTDEFWGEDTIRVGKYSPSLETLVLNIAATDFFAVKETKPKYSNLKYCINDWTSQMIRDNLFVYYFKDFWGQTVSGKLVHIRPCIPAFDEKQARAILKKRLYQSTSVITEEGKVAYNEDNISKELDKNTFPFDEFGLDNALGLKYVKLPNLDKVEINSWRRFDGSNSTELVLFFNEIFCRSEKTLFFKDNTYSSIAENPLLNGGETYEASLPCHAFTPNWWVTFFNYCMSFLFAEELGLSIKNRLSSDSFNKLPEIQKITFDEYNKFHKEETERLDKWAEDLKKEEERKEKERKAREEAEEKARKAAEKAAAEEKARKEAKMKILQPLINVRETNAEPTDMKEYTKSFFEYMKWPLEKRLENEDKETWVFSPSSYNARYLFEHRNDELFKNTFGIDKTPEEATDFCGMWASQYFFNKVKFPFYYEREINGKTYHAKFKKEELETQLENKKQDADFVKSNHVTIDDFRFFMNWNYAVWKSDKYDNIKNILSLKKIEHQEYFNTFFAIDKKRFSKKTLERCGISENNEAELGKERVRVARERAFPCNPNEEFLQNFYKATRRRKGLLIREYGKIYQYGVYDYGGYYYSFVSADLMELTHAINCLSDYYLGILKAIEGVEGNFTPYNEMSYEEYKKISWIIVSENGRDIINDKYVDIYIADKEAKQLVYEELKARCEDWTCLLVNVTFEEYYKNYLENIEDRMKELRIDHL